MSVLTEGFTVCLFLKEFLETESYKIDFIITEESPRRKQKAGKKRKVQEMMTEGILKVIYIHIIQLNRSTTVTLGTEKNGHCREDETRVNVWTVRRKKIAVVERWP